MKKDKPDTPKKRVVMIGGSYGSLLASRAIMSYLGPNTELTIVSPSTHIYFNFAAPRLLFEPEKVDQCMFGIEEQLRRIRSKCSLSFVQGTVVDVDLDEQKVMVAGNDSKQELEYDYLFIATGTTCDNKAFKLDGTHQETKQEIDDLNKKLLGSKSIAIVGGGPTGVETAGEIGYYCKGKIVFYTGKALPVHKLGEKRGLSVVEQMNELGVEVVNDLKYTSSTELPNGNTEITFTDGSTAEYETVVFTDKNIPNTDFIHSADLKDKKGFLKVDKHLRLPGYKNVMAIGDVVSGGGQSGIDIFHSQNLTFISYIKKELGGYNIALKEYKPMTDCIVLPVSKNGGVGLFHGFNYPKFLVRFTKGKNYMIPHAKRYIG